MKLCELVGITAQVGPQCNVKTVQSQVPFYFVCLGLSRTGNFQSKSTSQTSQPQLNKRRDTERASGSSFIRQRTSRALKLLVVNVQSTPPVHDRAPAAGERSLTLAISPVLANYHS